MKAPLSGDSLCALRFPPKAGWNALPRAEGANEGVRVFIPEQVSSFVQLATLPAKYCIRGRTLKLLLRNLMKDKLPQSVLAKKKQGLDIPVHDWLRGHLKPLLLDTLNQRTVEETGIVSWPYLESLIRLHMERKANYGYHLWGMLMLFLWIRQWKIECRQDLEAPMVASSDLSSGLSSVSV